MYIHIHIKGRERERERERERGRERDSEREREREKLLGRQLICRWCFGVALMLMDSFPTLLLRALLGLVGLFVLPSLLLGSRKDTDSVQGV